MDPARHLVAGDLVECEVDGVGWLRDRVATVVRLIGLRTS